MQNFTEEEIFYQNLEMRLSDKQSKIKNKLKKLNIR